MYSFAQCRESACLHRERESCQEAESPVIHEYLLLHSDRNANNDTFEKRVHEFDMRNRVPLPFGWS